MSLASHIKPAPSGPATPARLLFGCAALALPRAVAAASVAAASILIAPAASAQTVLAQTGFNNAIQAVEGWRRGEFLTGAELGAPGFILLASVPRDGALLMSVPAFDGAPVDSWLAPSEFLGNQSAALGGYLMFELGSMGATTGTDGVRLGSNGVELFFPLPAPNTASFFELRRYVVPLDPAAGWQTAGATRFDRTPTTLAEMAFVLGELESLGIRGNYYSPGDTGSAILDNVRLVSSVPEPTTALMWACGLAVAGMKLRHSGMGRSRASTA